MVESYGRRVLLALAICVSAGKRCQIPTPVIMCLRLAMWGVGEIV